MADILVRGLDGEAIRRLKARAKRNGRSLQGEVKLVLEQAAGSEGQAVAAILTKWHRRLSGRKLARSNELIRRDRER